jgi:ribosomal-protein-alanine N-acetyltransferase
MCYGGAADVRAEDIEIRIVSPAMEWPLASFFGDLRAADTERYFHPHPMTDAAAHERAIYKGKDLYYVLVCHDSVLAYGMLRGWDEGYSIPSLGIVVHPTARGRGLGRVMMDFLHAAASWRGAAKVRLRVYPDNATAVTLYRSLGYVFADEPEGDYLVGHLDLAAGRSRHTGSAGWTEV